MGAPNLTHRRLRSLMQPPKLPQLNIRGLRYEKRKIHVSSEEQVLPLKYLPLAWVAVLLTGLTGILIAMGLSLIHI